ncbi:hypothetical protein BU24DRAFT_497541 [Aaosphaeria arxii CBS 175.79]|uniref:Zn(2)-C6 fungal-type domain-containing protein n=1 Tax=Aaosphaeria arxii CBS 175.79 TaxID=1450172 RepID=A0A6A5X7P3_9PLEO|nr:uncharacterized protein BU24DRAFT_497541 [Aaosphaeria arxii CBS 175.79]KAF2008963.1 hypothetical protein BU24DRAFT_497541 [Aaosphaeria arxii CBS 175.79]
MQPLPLAGTDNDGTFHVASLSQGSSRANATISRYFRNDLYPCPRCATEFSRSDSLRRHLLTMHRPSKAGVAGNRAITRKRAAKACIACSRTKQRCSGDVPCHRCQVKSLSCRYSLGTQQKASIEQRLLCYDQETTSMSGFGDFRTDLTGGHQDSVVNLDMNSDNPTSFPRSTANYNSSTFFLPQFWTDPNFAGLSVLTSPETVPGQLVLGGLKDMLNPVHPEASWADFEGNITLGGEPTEDSTVTIDALQNAFDSTNSFHQNQSLPTEISLPLSIPYLASASPDANQIATGKAPVPPLFRSDNSTRFSRHSMPMSEELHVERVHVLEDLEHVPSLSPSTYHGLLNQFRKLNHLHDDETPFTDMELPPIDQVNAFIQAYFEDFHPIFPILHQPTFDPNQVPWTMVWAVLTTGCRFSRALSSSAFVNILQEILRRAIHAHVEEEVIPAPTISMTQAMVLAQIGLAFSGDFTLLDAGANNIPTVAAWCHELGCFEEPSDCGVTEGDVMPDLRASWKRWIDKETRGRLGYCAWMVDCQYSLFLSLPGVISSNAISSSMPCHDDIWQAESPEEWTKKRLLFDHSPLKSVQFALQELYQRRKQPKNLTFFNLLLLNLGLYRDALEDHGLVAYLDILRPNANTSTLEPQASRQMQVTLEYNYIIKVLLEISLQDLMAYAGWRVDYVQHLQGYNRLQRLFRMRSESMWSVVICAAQTFACVRDHSTYGPHESLALLSSLVILWAYIEFWDIRDDNQHPTGQINAEIASRDFNNSLICPQPDPSSLAGVGSLRNPRAPLRLTRECSRILLTRQAWRLSDAIRGNMATQYSFKWNKVASAC